MPIDPPLDPISAGESGEIADTNRVYDFLSNRAADINQVIFAPSHKSLRWVGTTATRTASTISLNRMQATPVPLRVPVTLDRLAIEITIAGGAGSVARLGIYADDGEGSPGALVLDAGTVPTDSTGVKTITISQELVASGVYWLAAANQYVGSSPTYRVAMSGLSPFVGNAASAFAGGTNRPAGFEQGVDSGALSDPFQVSEAHTATNLILVHARVA